MTLYINMFKYETINKKFLLRRFTEMDTMRPSNGSVFSD